MSVSYETETELKMNALGRPIGVQVRLFKDTTTTRRSAHGEFTTTVVRQTVGSWMNSVTQHD